MFDLKNNFFFEIKVAETKGKKKKNCCLRKLWVNNDREIRLVSDESW